MHRRRKSCKAFVFEWSEYAVRYTNPIIFGSRQARGRQQKIVLNVGV